MLFYSREILESMNGSERASVLFRRERSDDKDCAAVRRLQIDGCLENYDL